MGKELLKKSIGLFVPLLKLPDVQQRVDYESMANWFLSILSRSTQTVSSGKIHFNNFQMGFT
jgi:hypothetical protein